MTPFRVHDVFRYEFSGLIRAPGDGWSRHVPGSRTAISVPVRVSRNDGTYALPADEIAPFAARTDRF